MRIQLEMNEYLKEYLNILNGTLVMTAHMALYVLTNLHSYKYMHMKTQLNIDEFLKENLNISNGT